MCFGDFSSPFHDHPFMLDQRVRPGEPDLLRVVAIIHGDGFTTTESAPEMQKMFSKRPADFCR
jgi:hypothetical protein